jgi:hypothetical protein
MATDLPELGLEESCTAARVLARWLPKVSPNQPVAVGDPRQLRSCSELNVATRCLQNIEPG